MLGNRLGMANDIIVKDHQGTWVPSCTEDINLGSELSGKGVANSVDSTLY